MTAYRFLYRTSFGWFRLCTDYHTEASANALAHRWRARDESVEWKYEIAQPEDVDHPANKPTSKCKL